MAEVIIMAFFRTTLLLGLLTGILLVVGGAIAGTTGMTTALVLAFVMNFFAYWFSDKIVLAMHGAKPSDSRKLNSIVKKLAEKAGLPMPKVYIVNTPVPNAFATGRSPKHAAVAATSGLLSALNEKEIEGVLAHELAHVRNRDVLVSTMAAVIGGAIAFLAQMAWYGMFGRRERGTAMLLPLIFLAPLAATLVRLAISRGREYHADYTGAIISENPEGLASALEKISSVARAHPLHGNAATAHMWIVNPFRADTLVNLFSTHPPMAERVRRLRQMKI